MTRDSALAEYERRLATALQECIEVWNRAQRRENRNVDPTEENRSVYPSEVAGIGAQLSAGES